VLKQAKLAKDLVSSAHSHKALRMTTDQPMTKYYLLKTFFNLHMTINHQ